MKSETLNNKLSFNIKSEKKSELPTLDKGYINSKYNQIQESNERLQKLISKFTKDPQRKLNSVHESVIFKLNPNTKEVRENSIKNKNVSNSKTNNFKNELNTIFENPKIEKLNLDRNSRAKKIENFNMSKIQTKTKPSQKKNFVSMNKKDAFDPHGLAGRNATNNKQNENDKTSDRVI